MRYVGLGLWVKSPHEITNDDLFKVYDIYKASEGKPLLQRIKYGTKIIAQLCDGSRKVRWYHYFYLKKTLMFADLLGEKKGEYSDPKDQLNKFILWLAPKVNKTPNELIKGVGVEQFSAYADQIVKRDLDLAVSRIREQHIPGEYMKQLKNIYDELDRNQKKLDIRLTQLEEQVETVLDPSRIFDATVRTYQ
jgi:hypothetical protein